MKNYQIILLFLFFPLTCLCQNLSITEVYFDWTNEWIKIDNISQENYSWSIILSWAKSTPISLDLINIPQNNSLIIWDDLWFIENSSWCFLYSWFWLSLSDTKKSEISILYWSWWNHNIIIEEWVISKYNNTKKSLTFVWNIWTWSTTFYWSWWLLSPCWEKYLIPKNQSSEIILDEVENEPKTEQEKPKIDISTNQASSITTESTTQEKQLNYNDIFISEVYPRDNDLYSEYISIESHIDYTWSLLVAWLWHWLWSKEISFSIKKWEKKIITDSLLYDDIEYIVLPSISLTDSWEKLELTNNNWLLLHTFIYSWSYNYYATNISWNAIVPSITPHFINNDLCKISFWENKITIDNWYCKEPFENIWENNNNQKKWCELLFEEIYEPHIIFMQKIWETTLCEKEIYYVANNGVKLEDNISNIINTTNHIFDTLSISEVNPQNEVWWEYIELYCDKRCYWTINTIWLGRWDSEKELFIDMYEDEYVILHWWKNILPWYIKNIPISWLSLTNSWWEIIIKWQDGQLIDKVVYSWVGWWNSLYFNTWEIFTNSIPTPWVPIDFCFKEEDINTNHWCEIVLQNKNPIVFPKKINVITHINWSSISNWNKNYQCVRNSKEEISHWELEWCNPSYIWFDSWGIKPIWVDIFNKWKLVCSTSLHLNYPKEEEKEPNKTNYYKGLYQKRKSKYTDLEKNIKIKKDDQKTEETSEKNWKNSVYSLWLLQIFSVTPNPTGKDSWKEVVVIKNLSQEKLYVEKLYLERLKTKKLIWESITFNENETKTFTWSFWLTNKPSCIYLIGPKVEYDSFCYTKAEDDEVKTSNLITKEWFIDAVQDVDSYDISVFTWSVCIDYDWESLKCKNIPNSSKKLEKEKNENKKIKKDNISLKNQLKFEKSQSKKQYWLQKELIYLRKKTLQSNFYEIYTSNWFADSYSSYKHLYYNNFEVSVWPIALRSIDEHASFMKWIVLLQNFEIKTVYSDLIEDTVEIYNLFLEKLNH